MSDEQQDGMVYTVQGIERLEAEIDRLRAENAKLRAALKSFEQIAQYSAVWAADDKVFVPVFIVRAAAAALKGQDES